MVEEETLLESGQRSGGVPQLHEYLLDFLDGRAELGCVGRVDLVLAADYAA